MTTIAELNKAAKEGDCLSTLDPSMGSALSECARSFYYRYILGITPIQTPDYFISGLAWDAAKHAWLDQSKPVAERYKSAIRAMRNVYVENPNVNPRPQRTFENLLQLFALYVEQPDPPYKVLGSNLGFQFPYKDFFLGGELDSYLQWPPHGIVVGEDKTTIIVPGNRGWDNYADSFRMGQYANQQIHYQWACLQIVEEADFWGTCVEVACLDIPKRKSTIRQQFQPIWIPVNHDRIESYLLLCEYRMARLRHLWEKWTWPQEGAHCTGSYGFSRCPYLQVCRMNQPLEQTILPINQFKIGCRWEPWNHIKE